MKGIIFSELIEMIESTFGFVIAEEVINAEGLQNNGVYSNVGTYDFDELVKMLSVLSEKTQTPINKLLYDYGKYLSNTFKRSYSVLFDGHNDLFSFLRTIENVIHVEVLKLYNDASLPSFNYGEPNEKRLVMVYKSSKALSDLAEGLIQGCVDIFNENISITKDMLKEDGTEVKFTIDRT